jgi:hypothetical protein
MTEQEMIEKFVCSGCVGGMDTTCGQFKDLENDAAGCQNHVVGTSILGLGNFALGLPKGFNRAGWRPQAKSVSDHLNTMFILCWSKESEKKPEWDNLNVPVWALEKDGFLFVRTFSPRINETRVEVIEGGTLDLVPGAINVGAFYDEID